MPQLTPHQRWLSGQMGYYLLGRPKIAGLIRHFGVAKINEFGQSWVFEFDPKGARFSEWQEFTDGEHVTAEAWKPLTECFEIEGRIQELQAAAPDFNAITQNCEHVARYIWSGERESKQVKGYGWAAAGLLALMVFGRK
jgi:hypothetical protein